MSKIKKGLKLFKSKVGPQHTEIKNSLVLNLENLLFNVNNYAVENDKLNLPFTIKKLFIRVFRKLTKLYCKQRDNKHLF